MKPSAIYALALIPLTIFGVTQCERADRAVRREKADSARLDYLERMGPAVQMRYHDGTENRFNFQNLNLPLREAIDRMMTTPSALRSKEVIEHLKNLPATPLGKSVAEDPKREVELITRLPEHGRNVTFDTRLPAMRYGATPAPQPTVQTEP